MSLLTGTLSVEPLAGYFALSGYLPMHKTLLSLLPEESVKTSTKVFMGHGDQDTMVKYQWGRESAKFLKEFGFNVDFRTYKYSATLKNGRCNMLKPLGGWTTHRTPMK